MSEFKEMLKYFRTKEGLTQRELAEQLGMSTSRIAMYETGKREPGFESEEKIADFFHTDLNTLRGRNASGPEFPSDIRTAAYGMMDLSEADRKTAIDMIQFLSKRGREAKNNGQ